MPGRRRFRASPGVEHPEAPEAARRAALALLARRDHSSAELAAKLTAKGYTPEAAREAIEALREFEPFDRGLYAGPVGVVSREGAEIAVAIRSARIDGDEM